MGLGNANPVSKRDSPARIPHEKFSKSFFIARPKRGKPSKTSTFTCSYREYTESLVKSKQCMLIFVYLAVEFRVIVLLYPTLGQSGGAF